MTVLFDSVLVKWQGSIVFGLRAHGATGACSEESQHDGEGTRDPPSPPPDTTPHSHHQHHHLLVLTAHSSPHPAKQTLSFPFYIGENWGSGIHSICPWFYNLHEGKLIPQIHAVFTPHCLPKLLSKGLLGDLGTPKFWSAPYPLPRIWSLCFCYTLLSLFQLDPTSASLCQTRPSWWMTLIFPLVGNGCCLEDFWSSPIYNLTLSPRTVLAWTTSVTLPHFGLGLCSCDHPICTTGRPLWGQGGFWAGQPGLGPRWEVARSSLERHRGSGPRPSESLEQKSSSAWGRSTGFGGWLDIRTEGEVEVDDNTQCGARETGQMITKLRSVT